MRTEDTDGWEEDGDEDDEEGGSCVGHDFC